MEYRHTQWGYFAVVTLVILVPVAATVTIADDDPWSGGLVALAVLLIAALVLWFSRLRVTVESGWVTAGFGLGLPRKSIDLEMVTDVRLVRSPWYYGWGIRKVPGGWMYNVWGFDSVELEVSSGRVFRIGTDEPNELYGVLSLLAAR